MAVHTYEGMFLLDSNKYAVNPDATMKSVLDILTKNGANVLVSRPWQELKLAYPIGDHKKGLYFLAYFQMDGHALTAVNRACKLNEAVVRQLILQVEDALVEPLLAAATGEGGSFSKFHDDEATQAAEMGTGGPGGPGRAGGGYGGGGRGRDRGDRGGRERDR